jgi:hypothetical protein
MATAAIAIKQPGIRRKIWHMYYRPKWSSRNQLRVGDKNARQNGQDVEWSALFLGTTARGLGDGKAANACRIPQFPEKPPSLRLGRYISSVAQKLPRDVPFASRDRRSQRLASTRQGLVPPGAVCAGQGELFPSFWFFMA